MESLVTVLLPVYNGEQYLKLAIDSILNQTYKNIDLLLIDDGSTDGTIEIIKSYADPRIRLVRNEHNLGLTATFNKGIDLAIGKYVARMDADDIAINTRIEKQVNFLEGHKEVTMVDCVMEVIDKDGNSLKKYNSDIISEKEIRRSLPYNNHLGHSSIMIRANIYKKYKYRKTDAEDYDLWLRLANDNHVIHKIDEPLLKYRLHGNSYTDNKGRKRSRGTLRLAITKRNYLKTIHIRKRFTFFNISVFFSMVKDYIVGYIKYYMNYNYLLNKN